MNEVNKYTNRIFSKKPIGLFLEKYGEGETKGMQTQKSGNFILGSPDCFAQKNNLGDLFTLVVNKASKMKLCETAKPRCFLFDFSNRIKSCIFKEDAMLGFRNGIIDIRSIDIMEWIKKQKY